ncbi:MAG TPA: NUDIX hydrolase [Polyangiaceae bacterium]|nr:NUDIX hydrolase [Polyangiaceae bacterium]
MFVRKGTERVASFRIFDVLRHEMERRDGRPARDLYSFEFKDWVSVVPLTDDGQIVFVRQYRAGVDAPTLEVPGGVIDPGEEPALAATRELREETGYGEGRLVSLGWAHPNPVLQNNKHHMFAMHGARCLGRPEFDDNEHCELVLLPRADLDRAIQEGAITHALVLLALARAVAGDPDALGEQVSRGENSALGFERREPGRSAPEVPWGWGPVPGLPRRGGGEAPEDKGIVPGGEAASARSAGLAKVGPDFGQAALARFPRGREMTEPGPMVSAGEIFALLAKMEEQKAQKVIELARRIKPGLTAEDIRNPHDFPELHDMDWHFEDGQLAGIQSVVTAVRALLGDDPSSTAAR